MKNISRIVLLAILPVLLFANAMGMAQGSAGNPKDKSEAKASTEITETPLAKLDWELKQTKSTTTAIVLIESIADIVPQTDGDVALLGQLMDKYPVQGQKAVAKIKDPKLAKSVMKECDREAQKVKTVRAKGEGNLTDKDRQDYLNGYMNSAAAIDTLSKLNNKDAIPLLRGYLQDEDLSRFASVALGRLGDTDSFDSMLGNIGHGKDVDLSGYGDKGLVRVVEELGKPGIDSKRKDALIEQIKGSASPERKRMLKDLALNHKDPRVRDRSGLALLNSIIVSPDSADKAFISEWVSRTKNEENGYWAVTSIRVSHGNGSSPLDKSTIALLVDVLRTSRRFSTRSEVAESLGMFNVQEALPYLEECITKDKDSHVRGACMFAYFRISGKVLPLFHPNDIQDIEAEMNDIRGQKIMSRLPKNDLVRQFYEVRIQALKEYKRNHK